MTPHSPLLLITGGLGFIGINFIDFMLKKGKRNFRILDNLSVGSREALESLLAEHGTFTKEELENNHIRYSLLQPQPAIIDLIIGDIRNPTDCLQATQNAAAVLHLAAQSGVPTSVEDPIHDCEMNVTGTVNMLDACRINGADIFVFASSGAPLGEVEPPINEQKLPRPISPYGASKLAGEAYCHAYYKTFGIKTASLRFGNVYGPRSSHKTSVVAKFFRRALEGKQLEIYGDGTQTRDFIYTEDLCNAIFLCLKAFGFPLDLNLNLNGSAVGEVFQVATFKETTVEEIALKIKELVEKGSGKEVKIQHEGKRLGDVQRNFSDISKAMDILGFRPEYDLDSGLKKTWKSFL